MFVSELGRHLQRLYPDLWFQPRVNASIFRVNRDIRFSKDKTSYEPHIDLWFWHGQRRSWNSPGCYFRLGPKELILGGGMRQLDKSQLDVYREAVLDDKEGKALVKLAARLAKKVSVLGGKGRKTVPRGYVKDHPRAEWLLFNGLNIAYEGRAPEEVGSAAFVGSCARHAKAMWGINDWLLRVVR